MQTRGRQSRLIGELGMAGVFLLLAATVLYQTRTAFVKAGAASGGATQNAALYPELLALGLVVLGLLQIVLAIRKHIKPAAFAIDPAPPVQPGNLVRAIASTLLLVAYLLALKLVGYHLATPVFLASFFAVLGVRNIAHIVACSVLTSLVLSLCFEYGLGVILPAGRFGVGF